MHGKESHWTEGWQRRVKTQGLSWGEEGNNSVTQVGGRRFMTDFVSPQGFEKYL